MTKEKKLKKLEKAYEDKKLLDEIEYTLGFRPVNEPMTLEEIGTFFGLTRERVRQIETSALKKLSHPHVGRALRRYTKN